ECFQQGQLVAILTDQLGEALEHLLALLRGKICPTTLAKRSTRSTHRAVDVLGVTRSHPSKQFARARIDGIKRRARGRIDVVAADEGPRAELETPGALMP